MKKLVLAFVALTFIFSACNKEGVYSPKKKISTVYYQKAGEDEKKLYEEYVWNGNKLECKILNGTLLSSYLHDIQLVPIYDGKRIIRVNEEISGEYVDYIYEGKLLSKLIYHAGDDTAEAMVYHENGKISKIFFKAKNSSKACARKLWNIFLPLPEMSNMHKVLEQSVKNLAVVDNEILYEWEGDNVSKCRMNTYTNEGRMNSSFETIFQYDNMLNPWGSNWADLGSQRQLSQNSRYGRIFAMSKNNITQYSLTTTLYTESGETFYTQSSTANIAYEYDDNYPVKATHSDEDGDITGTYSFEYVK